jgi:hypothetical protein
MGASSRFGPLAVTVGGQRRTQTDQCKGRNARSGLFGLLTFAYQSDAWNTPSSSGKHDHPTNSGLQKRKNNQAHLRCFWYEL